jgi:hypothetical protein
MHSVLSLPNPAILSTKAVSPTKWEHDNADLKHHSKRNGAPAGPYEGLGETHAAIERWIEVYWPLAK